MDLELSKLQELPTTAIDVSRHGVIQFQEPLRLPEALSPLASLICGNQLLSCVKVVENVLRILGCLD